MFSKLIAAAVILAPLGLVAAVISMTIGYRGTMVAIYLLGGLAAGALCLWPVVNIFRGTLAPWSAITWIFLAVDICLLFLTMIPPPAKGK